MISQLKQTRGNGRMVSDSPNTTKLWYLGNKSHPQKRKTTLRLYLFTTRRRLNAFNFQFQFNANTFPNFFFPWIAFFSHFQILKTTSWTYKLSRPPFSPIWRDWIIEILNSRLFRLASSRRQTARFRLPVACEKSDTSKRNHAILLLLRANLKRHEFKISMIQRQIGKNGVNIRTTIR